MGSYKNRSSIGFPRYSNANSRMEALTDFPFSFFHFSASEPLYMLDTNFGSKMDFMYPSSKMPAVQEIGQETRNDWDKRRRRRRTMITWQALSRRNQTEDFPSVQLSCDLLWYLLNLPGCPPLPPPFEIALTRLSLGHFKLSHALLFQNFLTKTNNFPVTSVLGLRSFWELWKALDCVLFSWQISLICRTISSYWVTLRVKFKRAHPQQWGWLKVYRYRSGRMYGMGRYGVSVCEWRDRADTPFNDPTVLWECIPKIRVFILSCVTVAPCTAHSEYRPLFRQQPYVTYRHCPWGRPETISAWSRSGPQHILQRSGPFRPELRTSRFPRTAPNSPLLLWTCPSRISRHLPSMAWNNADCRIRSFQTSRSAASKTG